MQLDTSVIKSAVDKKYSAFADAVKTELHSKLANHEYSQSYKNDFDKINQMKSLFAKISGTNTEE